MIKTNDQYLYFIINFIFTFKLGITTVIPNTIYPDVQKSQTSLFP